jgi:two-component system, OmpR family, response regulator
MASTDPHPQTVRSPETLSSTLGPFGHILLVEDDPRLRQLIAAFLRGEGFQVDTAATGAEALARIELAAPNVVLLDVHLPDMDGLGLVRELRSRGFVLPVIVMTAAHDAQNWAREIGAITYISKPVSLPRLLRRLDDLSA